MQTIIPNVNFMGLDYNLSYLITGILLILISVLCFLFMPRFEEMKKLGD